MGNSGGPMFDMAGNVIGINSALISPTGASVGIGLAIPAEAAKPVIEALRRGQRPERGYLGVGLQPLDENIADSLGLPKDRGELVRSVVPGEPAARAGLQQGDVILRVGGRDVTPDETVSYLIANTSVGSRVPLEIIRDGRRQTVQVQVGQRPTEEELARQAGGGQDQDQALGQEAPVAPGTALGLSLQSLNPQIIRALNLPADYARRGRSPRSIRAATRPRRAFAAAMSSSRSTARRSPRPPRCWRRSMRRAAPAAPACCCWSSAARRPKASSESTFRAVKRTSCCRHSFGLGSRA